MSRGFPAILAIGCTNVTLLLALAGLLMSVGNRLPTDQALSDPTIDNLHRVSRSVLSGAGPRSRRAFATLRRLGVRTIVSVDGTRPDVESAERHGLRYVHIPIGYDGLPEIAAKMLTRVMQDCARPVFVHCHHGKHRGPAAAAICAIIAGESDRPAALEFLQHAGTSREYVGLWRDVETFEAYPRGTALPLLVAIAQTEPMVDAMVQIDAIFESLLEAIDADSEGHHKGRTNSRTLELSVLLQEQFREALRCQDPDTETGLRRHLGMAEQAAADLAEAARRRPRDLSALTREFRSICLQCHQLYRN